ncbi:MAG: hypothetical protein ACRDAM_15005 [Casimicrobium sp.]
MKYRLQFCDQSHYDRWARGDIATLVLIDSEPVSKQVAEKDAAALRAKGKYVEMKPE